MAVAYEISKIVALTCEYLFPFLAVMGIVGNSITLSVLMSRSMRSSTNELLAVAAACDILYIVCMIPNQLSRSPSVVLRFCNETDIRPRCPTKYALLFAEHKHHLAFLNNWFSSTSTWFIVAVSFDRLYAIKAPFSARSQTMCSRHNLIAIPLIFFLTGASCFHMNFKLLNDASTNKVANSTVTTEVSGGVSLLQVLTILMLIFHILIPILLLIALHFCLLYHLRNRLKHFFPARTRSVRTSTKSDEVPTPLLSSATDRCEVVRHHSSNSGVWNRHVNKAERHVTYTVIAIITCYIVSHIPSAVLYVYINLFHDALYSTKWMYTYVQLSTTVVTCSKVANFLLFCMSSKHFRKEMKKKLCFLFCEKKEVISQKDSANQPRTRSLPLNIIGDSTNNMSQDQ